MSSFLFQMMARPVGLLFCFALLGLSECNNRTSPVVSLIYKAIISCTDGDPLACLKKKTVHLLDKASSLDHLPLWGDNLVLVKSANLANFSESSQSTDRSVDESFANFLESHRIQLRLPRLSYFFPLEEGRKKKERGYGLVAMAMVGTLMAMGMAALAAMAGKALAASMAALMMAAMAAMKKGGGGGGGGHHDGHSSYEVISIPAHHHHRSFIEQQQMNEPYNYDSESHVHEKR